jgi:putative ABC transport system substrate-binding protein
VKPGRRAFIAAGIAAALASRAVEAQPRKVARIGYLRLVAFAPNDEAFRKGLRELGYVEGQNIQVEYRYAGNDIARLAAMAAALVDAKVDLIVAGGTQAIVAAKQATATIPIVFPVTFDPVASGFVVSVARPGGNLTGMDALNPVVTAKRVELLKEVIPGIARIAVFRNPTNPGSLLALRQTEVAAKRLGIGLETLQVQTPEQLEDAFAAAAKARADAIMVISDNFFLTQLRRIVQLAMQQNLPGMFDTRDFVEAGGLMCYGADLGDLYRRAAGFADKILKGAKPADLPVEQATKFDLVINRKTAKALRLTLPQSLLMRADQIID